MSSAILSGGAASNTGQISRVKACEPESALPNTTEHGTPKGFCADNIPFCWRGGLCNTETYCWEATVRCRSLMRGPAGGKSALPKKPHGEWFIVKKIHGYKETKGTFPDVTTWPGGDSCAKAKIDIRELCGPRLNTDLAVAAGVLLFPAKKNPLESPNETTAIDRWVKSETRGVCFQVIRPIVVG